MPVKDWRNTALVNTARRSYPSQCSEGNRASSVKARYTLPVSTGPVHGPYPRPVNTVSKMTPVFTGRGRGRDREHGPWTRVVCTELKPATNGSLSDVNVARVSPALTANPQLNRKVQIVIPNRNGSPKPSAITAQLHNSAPHFVKIHPQNTFDQMHEI